MHLARTCSQSRRALNGDKHNHYAKMVDGRLPSFKGAVYKRTKEALAWCRQRCVQILVLVAVAQVLMCLVQHTSYRLCKGSSDARNRCSKQTSIQRQHWPCMCRPHHELESITELVMVVVSRLSQQQAIGLWCRSEQAEDAGCCGKGDAEAAQHCTYWISQVSSIPSRT